MAPPLFVLNWTRSYLSHQHFNLFKHYTFTNNRHVWKSSYVRQSYSLWQTPNSISLLNTKNVQEKFRCSPPLIKNNKISFSTFPQKNSDKNKKSHEDSDADDDKVYELIPLMEFNEILWPSLFKSLKNIIRGRFIIKRHFDSDFDLNDFMEGAKQALISVSKILSEGNTNELKGLVTDEAIEEIRKNLPRMTLKQRQDLAVIEEDIYFGFIYLVGIMFEEKDEPTYRRFVEITTCFHSIRGFGEIKRSGGTLGRWQDDRHRINLANYRFIREYTKGVNGSWIINKLNHFKPINI